MTKSLGLRFIDIIPDDVSTKDVIASLVADLDSVTAIQDETRDFLLDDLDAATVEDLYARLKAMSLVDHTPKRDVAVSDNTPPSAETPPSAPVTTTTTTVTASRPAKQKRTVGSRSATKQQAAASAATAASDPQTAEPNIVATTQASRFHTETLETLSNDVDLKDVNITLNDMPILRETNLRLFAGVRYGLIGRNGIGKSTLLKCIAHGHLIGFPLNIKVLYVEQLENVDPSARVVDIVIDSQMKVVAMRKELELLRAPAEGDDDVKIALALRMARLGRLQADIEAHRKLSIKRSGARGWDVRLRLVELERDLEAMLKAHEVPPSANEIENAPVAVAELVEDINTNLAAFDAAAAESKALRILRGLGFSAEWCVGPISRLSGGWRIRVALAQALFIEPDLLLLDEPTNHLDLPAILWLQRYLVGLDATMVIVSHDRSFLSAVTTETIVMRDMRLTYHVGNYDEYVENTEEKKKRDEKRQNALDKKRAHIEKSIQEGLRQAKKSGDDKKLNMVASRQRKLDERFGLEVNEKGHRFKLNRDMVGYFIGNSRKGVEFEAAESMSHWSIPDPEPLRNSSSVLEVEDVSFSYTKGGPMVLRNVTLNVQMGEKIGIVGANGGGKSTFANVITDTLTPTSGRVSHHPQSRMAFVSQHHVTALPSSETPYTLLKAKAPEVPEKNLRAHLGGFGIGAIANQPIGGMSGGQRVRVAVALEVFGGPHILVLDEPTNHLDMMTIDAMLESLQDFEGAVIVISHDHYFLKSLTDRVYVVRNGRVEFLEGGVDEYVKSITKEI